MVSILKWINEIKIDMYKKGSTYVPHHHLLSGFCMKKIIYIYTSQWPGIKITTSILTMVKLTMDILLLSLLYQQLIF
jgi:hypothetical protein